MKAKVSESQIGIEYIADVISTCDKNGVECIVDDKNGDIFYYDPKRHKYGDDRLLMDNDASIWDIVSDEELFDSILFDASGAIFKDFAVRWNDLQKKEESDEVYKTKVCKPIIGKFTESDGECLYNAKSLNDKVASWYRRAYPTDKEMADEMKPVGATF